MFNLFTNRHGMNIIGQGGKIILFMLPSLVIALLIHSNFPTIAALPNSLNFVKILGLIWLIPGILLWCTALVQLLTGFPKGKLVTTGAYGIVRNPIYSSVTFFILPAISLITMTWVYFIPAIFLYLGVIVFIKKEEKQLSTAFGQDYEEYKNKVDRMIPFKKPY